MFHLIYEDNYKVKGWACSTSDTTTANLAVLVAQNPNLASSSYVRDVDTDNFYIFNQDSQVWRME